jgi:hypothetical protein
MRGTMKKLIVLLFVVCAFGQNITRIQGVYTPPELFFTAGAGDTVTTDWQNLGAVIDVRDYTQLNLYLTLDVNLSENVRVRALGKVSSTVGSYPFSIETISSTLVKIQPEYVEFDTDADQSIILKIQTDGVPYIQLQYQAGTKGATPAKFTNVYINKVWK